MAIIRPAYTEKLVLPVGVEPTVESYLIGLKVRCFRPTKRTTANYVMKLSI